MENTNIQNNNQNTKEKVKKILESKVTLKVLYVLGILIVVMLVFHAGVMVGFRKASFGNAWERHYNENFGIGHPDGMRRGGIMAGMGMTDFFPDAHGALGKIIKIELPNVILEDKDKIEKIVTLDADTRIQNGRDDIKATDLKTDDFIVVIGTPNNQGTIDAKFIRLIPAPQFLTQ